MNDGHHIAIFNWHINPMAFSPGTGAGASCRFARCAIVTRNWVVPLLQRALCAAQPCMGMTGKWTTVPRVRLLPAADVWAIAASHTGKKASNRQPLVNADHSMLCCQFFDGKCRVQADWLHGGDGAADYREPALGPVDQVVARI